MSDNREILRTTLLKGMVPARIRGQEAVDTYATTIVELEKRCGSEVASLFAEPVRPSRPDPANPQMTWYTPLDGQMLDLATIDEVARRPIISLLRRRLEQLKPVLNDPDLGPVVAAWLNITSPNDLLSVGGNPVLLNWGYLPQDVAQSGIMREAHFADTIGRYMPELQRPPFTSEEAASYGDRVRNNARAPAAAMRAAKASGAAIAPVVSAANGRPSLKAPLIAVAVAAAMLAGLLWPGVLVRPDNDAARAALQRETELVQTDNEGLEERAKALEAAAKERVCRLPDGQLAPLAPLPGQAPPATLTPHTDLLPPSPDRVQITPPVGGPSAQPTSLNALLDGSVVIITDRSQGPRTALGSGFFVSPDRIITNRHVVLEMSPNSIQVTNKALGEARPARLLALSAPREVPLSATVPDFALLAVDMPGDNFLSVGPSPAKSTAVVAVGFPGFLIRNDADFQAYVKGNQRSAPGSVTQQGFIIQRRESDPVKLLTHSANLGHGNSGGPLVDFCGRVVGVNTAVVNEGELPMTANLAQDVSELRAFLDKNGVTPKIDEAQTQCPPAVTPPGPAAQAGPAPSTPDTRAPPTPAPSPTPRP
jgi:hypothetical protein